MTVNHRLSVLFQITLFVTLTFSETKSPLIFLCLDSMNLKNQAGKGFQKLVYSYINGKKTPCMSEHELRLTLSNKAFARDHDSLKAFHKKLLLRNAVYRGEKNLAYADLRGLDLQGLDLSGANLQNALLESADMRGANLRNADLTKADLQNAYCKNADFSHANLTDALLKDAYFHHANLQETNGLTIDNLRTVSTLYDALLAAPVLKIIKSKYPSKLKNPKGGWCQKVFPEQQEFPVPDKADPRQFH